jgi:hypothetical protein
MTAPTATRRLVALDLMETAARLCVRGGPDAARWCRACWRQLAALESGCCCLADASDLVASARQWLETAA